MGAYTRPSCPMQVVDHNVEQQIEPQRHIGNHQGERRPEEAKIKVHLQDVVHNDVENAHKTGY